MQNTRLVHAFTAAVLAVSSTSFGQSTFGSIVGDVKDGTEAMIGGAVVTLTNIGTNERRETLSDRDGFYQFQNLVPASYRLEAEMSGFRRHVQEPILIEVQR